MDVNEISNIVSSGQGTSSSSLDLDFLHNLLPSNWLLAILTVFTFCFARLHSRLAYCVRWKCYSWQNLQAHYLSQT